MRCARKPTNGTRPVAIAVAVEVLNRMVVLGWPRYVRIHETRRAWDHSVNRLILVTRSGALASGGAYRG